ncbi:MAG TPA: Sec-independent protein translocase protein TatB [Solirubrobacterales bacterium]|nr:Sec-independent protein translocase protein TatB [Solirubrobacterales bacterium]
MPQIGPLEILAVSVIALVVFGPQRLPEIARNIGKAINELRRMSSEVRNELSEGMSATEGDEPETPEPAKAAPADPDEEER